MDLIIRRLVYLIYILWWIFLSISLSFLGLNISSEIFSLFFVGLESTMSQLGGSIDEFQVNLLQSSSGGLWDQWLSKHNNLLLGSNTTSLDDNEIILDNTVVWESTQWGNLFISDILWSGSTVDQLTVGNSVDLFVHFSSVVITQLTSSGNTELDSWWMPSSNTTNLSKTSMWFFLQMSDTKSLDDTGNSLTLSDSNNVNHLVLFEDLINLDFLLEKSIGKVNLIGNSSSIDLNFNDVVLLLSEVKFVHLGVCNNSDDWTIFLNSFKWNLDRLGLVLGLSLLVLGEGLSLGVLPVLIESSEGVLV